MKIILSPAKSMDFESELPTGRHSDPAFLPQAERLNRLLRKKSARSLGKLMNISANLAQLNYDRNQTWSIPFTSDNSRPAIFAFNGEAYRGFDGYTLKEDQLDYLQDSLRIISGLYGLLKPLDLIQPYRLEMGTRMPVGVKKNLYEFWKPTLTDAVNAELEPDELFVNLASNEYSKAIEMGSLKGKVVNVQFKELRDGKYKTIMSFAKLARGTMARYLVDIKANTLDDVKGFDRDNYLYSEALSSETELVFTR